MASLPKQLYLDLVIWNHFKCTDLALTVVLISYFKIQLLIVFLELLMEYGSVDFYFCRPAGSFPQILGS